jgi:putative ABC transport system permease protein
MFEILKNMFRRKVRTILTICGIAIGILALVVMGAMAEKIQLLVDGGVKYYGDKVIVSSAEGGLFGGAPMTNDQAKPLEKVEGVNVVSATVSTTLNKEMNTVNFGPPASIQASDNKGRDLESFKITMSKGRDLKDDDKGKVVVGADLVKKLDAEVGKEVEIRGKKFEVVGIMEKTLTAPDSSIAMPMSDAQQIVYDDLPDIVKRQVKPSDIVSSFVVYPKSGVNPNDLAEKISKEVPTVKGMGPKVFKDQIEAATKVLNQILYGIAAISLMVGSLSVINTMTMSISERTKEIGIKKAVGAKTGNILFEYLTEAGFIGLFGGLIGLGVGGFIVTSINAAMAVKGDKLFLLTPRLMIGAVVFSVVLGIVAGIFPAVHATRISIVKSLREE